MGTHPNCPSTVASTGQSLSSWIQQHQESLGTAVQQRFGVNLPFLFKVLSVSKALSIQSHPNKQLAEQLRRDHPKPEMALALEDGFEALCSFASLAEILQAVREQPELAALVKAAAAAAAAAATFAAVAAAAANAAIAAANASAATANASAAACASAASEGQLMECMAASDNVIRAGLTPKFKHTEVLCSSLTYMPGFPEVLEGASRCLGSQECKLGRSGAAAAGSAGLEPASLEADPAALATAGATLTVYRPPFEEFEIRRVDVPAATRNTLATHPVTPRSSSGGQAGAEAVLLPADPGPQILLVQQGEGRLSCAEEGGMADGLERELDVSRGSILFVPAATALTLHATQPLTIWVAAVNATFFQLAAATFGSQAPAEPAPAQVVTTA
ncbi:mannose-6-phosphate isomerase [Haematococcus lacustris]|uniref:Mannose-6-phosphate isomerase n=1 Tax=Haematococcus lacustris TaxID=44745 RepID=A0A699YKM5_HAELA|nr:mannose-6-phosphate isomerase [Haematococcus lacustris]